MKKVISIFQKLTLAGIFIVGLAVFALTPAVYAGTLSPQEEAVCKGAGGWVSSQGCALPGNTVQGTLRAVSDILIFIIGAIAVIMIIIGGIRYATSGGDQAQITGAKNTILYSVIGLVVAFMAYGIARFVVDRL